MNSGRKQRICALLKGIETGDPASVNVINPSKYIQHNPQTQQGREGLTRLFQRLAKSAPRVNIARVFADGDYVFAHTEYDFSTRRVGFEVFRFEGEQTVEHWDNIQPRQGPNASGRSMVDGVATATNRAQTETNRALVRSFVETVQVGRHLEKLADFVDADSFLQHDPELQDGLASLRGALEEPPETGLAYRHLHRVLAEGDFVLAVSEGERAGFHTAFYDLYRVADGKLAEHWNTVERVPPPSEWKHSAGKF